jgi:hypothetical protein
MNLPLVGEIMGDISSSATANSTIGRWFQSGAGSTGNGSGNNNTTKLFEYTTRKTVNHYHSKEEKRGEKADSSVTTNTAIAIGAAVAFVAVGSALAYTVGCKSNHTGTENQPGKGEMVETMTEEIMETTTTTTVTAKSVTTRIMPLNVAGSSKPLASATVTATSNDDRLKSLAERRARMQEAQQRRVGNATS